MPCRVQISFRQANLGVKYNQRYLQVKKDMDTRAVGNIEDETNEL